MQALIQHQEKTLADQLVALQKAQAQGWLVSGGAVVLGAAALVSIC
jgi:hypothetical protein